MNGDSVSDYLVLALILGPCVVFIMHRARRMMAKGGGCGGCGGGSDCEGRQPRGKGPTSL